MRELLTPADCGCASITPCCDPVYKPDAEDCIHRALYEMVASWSQDYLKKESFGMALGEDVTGIELRHAELHYAIWLVIHAHRERQIAFDATGVVPDQAIYWEKYKLGCVSDYLKSNYGVNGETFLGVAGFYDPERGNACVLTGCDPIIDTWPQPEPEPEPEPPASPCTQPTSLHIVVPEGESVDSIVIDVSDAFDGYFMIEGDLNVHAVGDGGVPLSSGEYCLYTTDASGVPNGAATTIELQADSLTTLDVSAWTAATSIYLYADGLTTLDTSAWTAATTIELYADSLTTLDVSAWTAATTIYLSANSLTTLDVSAWTAATSINLYADGLTMLDASAWTAATYINLYADSLTALDVPSVLAAVTYVAANNCPLDQASVDAILAAAVANPAITSASFNLDGSCAAPSAAGYADKATLIARGCTVYTN